VLEHSTPGPLEAICLKALEKRPEDRYLFPEQLAEEVRRFLAGEPVEAHRETSRERLGRRLRKHTKGRAVLSSVTKILANAAAMWVIVLFLLPGKKKLEDKEQQAKQALQQATSAGERLKQSRARYRYVRKALKECVGLRRDPRLLPELGRRLLAAEAGFLGKELGEFSPERQDQAERAQTEWRLGEIEDELGRAQAAVRHYHWSLDIEEHLARHRIRDREAPRDLPELVLDPKEASEVAERGLAAMKGPDWTARREMPGGTQYNLACLYAQCVGGSGEAERYAARAVQRLRQAGSAGFFRVSGNLDGLRKDKQLGPLRDRDDFRRFLAGLNAAGRHDCPLVSAAVPFFQPTSGSLSRHK
jgi:hypothetical protein